MPTKKNILYIDNEKKYREKVKPVFKKRGYRILLCESGKSGLIKLMKYKPDVVIVNYELPDITGEEFYTKFIMDSEFCALRSTPFIALTNNGHIDKSELYSLGFSACFGKPFKPIKLVDFIEDFLVSHQLKMDEVYFWETIRESKDFLEKVVESSVDSIVTTDIVLVKK